jgi:hypothetical protein
MRFFRYSFIFILIFTSIAIGAFLAVQQWVLFQAYNQLLADALLVQRSKHVGEYYDYCTELGAENVDDGPLYTPQLRFLSDTEYVLEVVCDQYEFVPKQFGKKQLPLFASKKPGQSGLVFAEEGAWSISIQAVPADLETWLTKIAPLENLIFRARTISVEDGSMVESLSVSPNVIEPITACEGYGFSCCDPVRLLGVGEQRPGNDCSDDCYSSCHQRPIILSFNAEPGFDRYQRILQASQADLISFNFVIDSLLPEESQVTLEFGDGTSWIGIATETMTTHQYSCNQPVCNYQATLKVVDAYGTESANTTATEMNIAIHQ